MTRTLTEAEALELGLWEGAVDIDTCGLPGGELELSPDELAVLHEAQSRHRAWRGLCPEDRAPMHAPMEDV